MEDFEKLIEIARRKTVFDEDYEWSNGSATYLSEIKKEVDEVVEELPKSRKCYLEYELGDILWDYLNIVLSLEKEQGVDLSSVIKRASKKYEERVSGIESGELWQDIKARQKTRLAEEQESLND